MASFNRVILLGNLTRDPELRYTPSGTGVTEIGLAVNDKRKGQNGEWIEEATFVDITLWGRTAEVATEYLRKGSPVLIEGRLKYDQWEDKNGGGKRSKLRVVGEKMQLLGTKGGGEGGNSGRGNAGGQQRSGQSGGGSPNDEWNRQHGQTFGGEPAGDMSGYGPPPAGDVPQDEIPF